MTLRLLLPTLLTAAACAEAPVARVVPLSFDGRLPTLETVVGDTGLRLALRGLEPATEGALVAWGRSSAGLSSLGPLTGELTTLAVTEPLALEEVLVTHELVAAPTAPSAELLFRGLAGEALALGGVGGPTAATLQAAQVSAHLEDRHLELESTGLPWLGGGLHYALWVRHEGEAAVALGRVDSAGAAALEGEGLLAAFDEVLLTLELDAGPESPGAELMTGHVLGDDVVTEAPQQAHDH